MENILLCDRILKETGGHKELAAANLRDLRMAMEQQGRLAEASALRRRQGNDAQSLCETWKAVLDKAGIVGNLTQDDQGGLQLDLQNTAIADLSALKGMPLKVLKLRNTRANDLRPLKDMPLTWLDLAYTTVSDIGALEGMPLKVLNLWNTAVRDLRPLTGMPLTYLDLFGAPVSDISPLKELPLVSLDLAATMVSDISHLRGMRLENLDLAGADVTDVRPLEGMPLKTLRLDQCDQLQDLTPVAQCPQLERLTIPHAPKGIGALRKLQNLKFLSFTYDDWKTTALEFWTKLDSEKNKSLP